MRPSDEAMRASDEALMAVSARVRAAYVALSEGRAADARLVLMRLMRVLPAPRGRHLRAASDERWRCAR